MHAWVWVARVEWRRWHAIVHHELEADAHPEEPERETEVRQVEDQAVEHADVARMRVHPALVLGLRVHVQVQPEDALIAVRHNIGNPVLEHNTSTTPAKRVGQQPIRGE